MKECWRAVKVFVWYPLMVVGAYDCDLEEALAMIRAGRISINGVTVKDTDLGLGGGTHNFKRDGHSVKILRTNGGFNGRDLRFSEVGTHMESVLRSGEKAQIGRAVVQKHGQTLSVCYHEVLPEERGYDLVGFNGNGGMLTGCMANI